MPTLKAVEMAQVVAQTKSKFLCKKLKLKRHAIII
jgi:hypothetical protein